MQKDIERRESGPHSSGGGRSRRQKALTRFRGPVTAAVSRGKSLHPHSHTLVPKANATIPEKGRSNSLWDPTGFGVHKLWAWDTDPKVMHL